MLGEELQRIREAAGLTQETVAAKAGISREYLSKIENDHSSPTVEKFLRIFLALDVRASRIIARMEKSGSLR